MSHWSTTTHVAQLAECHPRDRVMDGRRFDSCHGCPNNRDMKEVGSIIANVLTDIPIGFEVGSSHFDIYPTTLGKIYLTSQLLEGMEVNRDLLKENPFLEALRIISTKREECCRLIAYHTLKSKEEILCKAIVQVQQKVISGFSNKDIATLLVCILKDNLYQVIVKETGIEEETKRMAKVNAAKKSSGQYIFGGKTIWGSLIDVACERYGWTFDYVVWGISYTNLSLMLKDKITSIYLSDEERKHAHLPSADEEVIDGNNKEAVMRAVRESESEF